MYFGVLTVGADVAGGFLAMNKAKESGHNISLAFKHVEGEFLKRPEADVVFTCKDGDLIDDMLSEAINSGDRINNTVKIIATCPAISAEEIMARFYLTLSIKVMN